MALSKKRIKAIVNAARTKTVLQLSQEFQVSPEEIQELLKSHNQEPQTIQNTEEPKQQTTLLDKIEKNGYLHTFFVSILAVFLAIAPFRNGDSTHYDFANLMQEVFIQGSAVIMVIIWLLDSLALGKLEIKRSSLYWPIIAILSWTYLSLLWTDNQPESMATILQWTASALIFFVLLQMIRSSFDTSILLYSILFALVRLIYIGIVQFFDVSDSSYNQIIRPSGTFGNKNMFCDYLTITLPLGFYFFSTQLDTLKNWTKALLGILLYTSGVVLVFYSFTRAGFVNIPIVLILFLAFTYLIARRQNKSFFTRKRLLLLSFGILVFIIAIVHLMFFSQKEGFQWENYKNRIKSVVILPDKDRKKVFTKVDMNELQPVSDSTGIRLIAWLNTLVMIKDKPVQGFGLNNWQIHYADYRNSLRNDPTYQPGLILAQVHNDYLQMAVELGLVGLGLFFWLAFLLAKSSVQILYHPNADEKDQRQTMAVFFSLVGFAIACCFSFLMVKAIPTMLFCVYAAIIGSLFHKIVKPQNKPDRWILSSKVNVLLLLGLIAVSFYIIPAEAKRAKADVFFKTANDAVIQQKFDQAITAGNETLAIAPHLKKTYFLLANGYSSIGDFENANKAIEMALRYYPNDLMGLFQAGTNYIRQLKAHLETPNPDPQITKMLEDKTIEWYSKALKIREDFDKIWNNMGFIYERRAYREMQQNKKVEAEQSLNEAVKCFENAFKYKPYYADAVLNKANILLNTERKAEAAELSKNILFHLSKQYKVTEEKLAELEKQNYPKTSGIYSDAFKAYSNAREEYLLSAPKAISIIRNTVAVTKDYASLLPVLEEENNLLDRQLKDKLIKFKTAETMYQQAKLNPATIRQGVTLEQLEKEYQITLNAAQQAEKSFPVSKLMLSNDQANANLLLNNKEEFIKQARTVIAESNRLQQFQVSTTLRLLMVDFYLREDDLSIKENFEEITDCLQKATYLSTPTLTETKKQLQKKYDDAKRRLQIK